MAYTPIYYTDSTGKPIEIEILSERQQIGIKTPTITLKKIPSKTRPIVIKKIINKYNKQDTVLNFVDVKQGNITSANQFKVDYENRQITFHKSQKGLYVSINFTALGYFAITADEVIAKEGNNGECIQTLRELIDEGQEILEGINTLGGATRVISELDNNVSNGIKLISTVEEATLLQNNLSQSVFMGKDLLERIDAWLVTYADVVDLEARVDMLEKRIDEIAPVNRVANKNQGGGSNEVI